MEVKNGGLLRDEEGEIFIREMGDGQASTDDANTAEIVMAFEKATLLDNTMTNSWILLVKIT